ncbi:MAG TPA: hypothetical protein VFI24_12870 [Pyrinomonadaceae bacterium]|nr:hypothetical protein [Pyrinomonadaceae bacterium]
MELLAIRTARVIAYLNAEELNPSGRPIAHDFMNAFVERYSFVKRPTTADEILDSQNKGLTFELGKFGDVGINKLIFFDWGVVIETSTSTDASEKILQDILDWGAERFGLSNRPTLISQKNYLSELVFSSEMSLPAISPMFEFLGKEITDLVRIYLGNSLPFETVGITLAFDSTESKQLFTPFTIQRVTDTPFPLKKYYSGAPLRTSDHIRLLNQFEKVIQEA